MLRYQSGIKLIFDGHSLSMSDIHSLTLVKSTTLLISRFSFSPLSDANPGGE